MGKKTIRSEGCAVNLLKQKVPIKAPKEKKGLCVPGAILCLNRTGKGVGELLAGGRG